MTNPQSPHGPLRSYGRIKSRPIKPRQEGLLTSLLPRIAVPDPLAGPIDLEALMPGAAEAWLEIGFGGGEHLAGQAKLRPDVLLIGAEPFLNGVASALRHVEEMAVENVRLHHGDAREVVNALPAASLARVFILFPDPWQKARHHKRRLVQAPFLGELARVMRPGARVRFATDWADYAEWALERFAGSADFSQIGGADRNAVPADHLSTRYELKKLGDCTPVFLEFERT